MALQRRGSAARKHAARRDYLAARRAMWADVPGINDDVTEHGRAALMSVVAMLRRRGLLGGSTLDVQRDTVRRVVSELRGESVGVGLW